MQNFYNNPYNYYPQQAPYQANNSPNNNYYAFVDGIEGARAFQVKPNSMMLLMDSQQPICYKKQVDAYGRTVSIEAFKLEPITEKAPTTNDFISREEFEKQIAEIKALINKEV